MVGKFPIHWQGYTSFETWQLAPIKRVTWLPNSVSHPEDRLYLTFLSGLEELAITKNSPFVGATVKGLQDLTLKRKDGEVMLTPTDETPIQSGDGVVLLGALP